MHGNQLSWLALGALALLSLALLIAALVSRRVDSQTLLRGAGNGLLVAAATSSLVVVSVTLLANGQRVLWGTLDLGGAFALGLLIGISLAVGYFWLGSVLMVGGLLLGAQRSWATRGAWLAAPVAAFVFVSAGGFALAMAQRAGEPVVVARPGQLDLRLEGARPQPLTIAGAAVCEASSSGTFEVFAGEQGAPPINGPAGEEVALQLTIHDEFPVLFSIRLDELGAYPGRGWDISPQTVRLSPGWTRGAGELAFSGLVPLDSDAGEPPLSESWRGTLGWACND